MFIVWGTKVVEKKLGRVADFCPICRGYQPFRATRVESVGHLYYIPLGRRTTLGFQKQCETCGVKFNSEVSEHLDYSRSRRDDLETLIARTNPSIAARSARRLDYETRARAGRLSTGERGMLIREPFLLLNTLAETRGKAIERDTASVLGIAATLFIPALLIVAAKEYHTLPEETATTAAIVIGGCLALTTLGFMITSGHRYNRRVLVPKLARTLRPLAPSLEELDDVIKALRTSGLRIAKGIKPQTLFEAIQVAGEP